MTKKKRGDISTELETGTDYVLPFVATCIPSLELALITFRQSRPGLFFDVRDQPGLLDSPGDIQAALRSVLHPPMVLGYLNAAVVIPTRTHL